MRRGAAPGCDVDGPACRPMQDFGDGGAFPEIAVAQYPLGMGKPRASGATLPLRLDGEGHVRYDAIAVQGHGKDVVVHATVQSMVRRARGLREEHAAGHFSAKPMRVWPCS